MKGRPQKNPPNHTNGEVGPVKPMITRHNVQILRQAGHIQEEVAEFTRTGLRTVQRIDYEPPVGDLDDKAEMKRRRIGRPSKTEAFRKSIEDMLRSDPDLMSLELLRRARELGYSGEKSAFFELVKTIRPKEAGYTMRFEGLPGEFTQHDFGHVEVTFLDGTEKKITFFASRLKWSRWAEVTIVPDEKVETLVRTIAAHFASMGGIPLLAVFDRPKTVAISWDHSGKVTEWNHVFASALFELGVSVDVDIELCWPYHPQEKGSIERVVQWVKNSFFRQRRFHDEDDLREQLAEWLREINECRPSDATHEIPAIRFAEEQRRLRPLKVSPENLALRYPVYVGPTAMVRFEGRLYSMPPEAACVAGTMYVYRDSVRIVVNSYTACHPRIPPTESISTLPEHRSARLAALSGKRGKRYLKRQDLLETGKASLIYLTEILYNRKSWISEVDRLHVLLQRHGSVAMDLAFQEAVQAGIFSADFVEQCLERYQAGQQVLTEVGT
jgi:transposase